MTQRSLYLQSSEEYFHVYNRGVNRERIFYTGADYECFLRLMSEAFDPALLSLDAFTLMPNHFHLILKQHIPRALSKFMKSVCERYATYLNFRTRRKGHLFQGRYKMKNFDEKKHLLYLSRYVHLNPVHANLVKLPEEWPYSSCRDYIRGNKTEILTTNVVLSQAGGKKAYSQYLREMNFRLNDEMEDFVIDRELA